MGHRGLTGGGRSIADLARLRGAAYRFLGAWFLYPDDGRLAQLVEVARLLEAEEAFAHFPFFGSWQRALRLLTGAGRPPTATLEDQYVRLFVVNPEGTVCPPYESFYLDPDPQAAGWVRAQLKQEYATAGLALAPAFHGLPDHVSVELEFMAFLCSQETDAWDRQDPREGMEFLKRQRTFLERHLGRWFPDFAREVQRADPSGLYGSFAAAAAALIHHDLDLLPLLLETFCEVLR